jgi:hypothetical protein
VSSVEEEVYKPTNKRKAVSDPAGMNKIHRSARSGSARVTVLTSQPHRTCSRRAGRRPGRGDRLRGRHAGRAPTSMACEPAHPGTPCYILNANVKPLLHGATGACERGPAISIGLPGSLRCGTGDRTGDKDWGRHRVVRRPDSRAPMLAARPPRDCRLVSFPLGDVAAMAAARSTS